MPELWVHMANELVRSASGGRAGIWADTAEVSEGLRAAAGIPATGFEIVIATNRNENDEGRASS